MSDSERIMRPTNQAVYQSTAISRSAHDLSVQGRRLLYAAASCIKLTDTEIPTVTMRLVDIARAVGLADDNGEVSGRVYEYLWDASDDLMTKLIYIRTANGGWDKFQWVHRASYDPDGPDGGTFTIRFSDEVKEYLLGIRNSFSVFMLRDIGKLQGKYALRIFELVIANQGFAGEGGNKKGEWYVDLLFADFRRMLCLGPNEYKLTYDFRRWVVDSPVREINAADLGIRIECDYDTHRVGRSLRGVRLLVKQVERDEPKPVSPATLLEMDEAEVIARYPDRYAELVRQAAAAPQLFGPGIRLDPENEALRILLEEVKDADAKAKPKRGRPRKATT